MTRIALDDPRYYFNRHVQWLEFNQRYLCSADWMPRNLYERVETATGSPPKNI